MLIETVSVDLDELFQDGRATTGALDCEASGIVEMAVDLPLVLVVAVLRSEDRRAHRAGEVLDVKFHV